jgi:hypothetical protein
MTGKRKKIATSFLLQVFENKEVSIVKNTIFPGCSSLSALIYSSLAEVQKFITLRPLAVSGSVNNPWKAEELIYALHVYAPT